MEKIIQLMTAPKGISLVSALNENGRIIPERCEILALALVEEDFKDSAGQNEYSEPSTPDTTIQPVILEDDCFITVNRDDPTYLGMETHGKERAWVQEIIDYKQKQAEARARFKKRQEKVKI